MRTLRNWLSHARLTEDPTEEEFLILFVMILRAYFGFEDKETEYEKEAEYEKDALRQIHKRYEMLDPQENGKETSLRIYENVFNKIKGKFSTRFVVMLNIYGDRGGPVCTYDIFVQFLWTLAFPMKYPFDKDKTTNEFKILEKDAPLLADILRARAKTDGEKWRKN
jgi:hypothetical protein